MIIRPSRILAIIVLLSCFTACGEEKKKGKATSNVGVAEKASPGTLAVPSSLTDSLTDADQVSFTPTSLKVTIEEIYLSDQVTNGDTAPMGTRQVHVPINKEVELIDQSAFGVLAEGSSNDIDKKNFGDYAGVLVTYSTIKLSGTIPAYGVTISDYKIDVGSSGYALNLPTAVTVDENTAPTVRALFAVDGCAFVTTESGASTFDGKHTVRLNKQMLLPFAGDVNPTLERYDVTLDSDSYGDKSKYKLRVVVFRDTSGAVASAGWYAIYAAGFKNLSTAFSPGRLENNLTVKGDGSYKFKTNPASDPPGKSLTIEYFQLSTHNGSLVYGDTSVAYSARKL